MKKERTKILKSISGVRGIYGPGGLSEDVIIKYISAYIRYLEHSHRKTNIDIPDDNDTPLTILVGRDGRHSGSDIKEIVIQTLLSQGVNIIDADMATTPGIAYNVLSCHYSGGIMITASHNTQEWNGLKLMNSQGENLNSKEWTIMDTYLEKYCPDDITNTDEDTLSTSIPKQDLIEGVGELTNDDTLIHYQRHIDAILSLDIIDVQSIRSQEYKVAVDTCNSSASIGVMLLARKLDLEVEYVNSNITGSFHRDPEPNDASISDLTSSIHSRGNIDVGFSFDPDVDRLLVIDEKGKSWGEEYSLIAAADHVLSQHPGNVVSNMSSSIVLRDIAIQYNRATDPSFIPTGHDRSITMNDGNINKSSYYSSPVGEAHVVQEIKRVNAIIGGEGNGGIIYPELSHCRDALLGMAIILSSMATKKLKSSELRKGFPPSYMSKKKYTMSQDQWSELITKIKYQYKDYPIDDRDGIKIYTSTGWVHLRRSNTEPVIRLISEASNLDDLEKLNTQIDQIVY